jgi:hypothetical protein
LENIEYIRNEGILYGIVIRTRKIFPEATEFYTPKDNSLQVGLIRHSKGYVEPPHIHRYEEKTILDVQETLHIEHGRIKINFYDNHGAKIDSKTLFEGDVVLLAKGGHNIEVLEDFVGVKVKQGPYLSIEKDKEILEVKI